MAIAGVVGGVFAASASHPFDTIKTRMQAHMYSKPEYLTWTSTAATIYKEGGVLNFWRGLLPRMTRIIGEPTTSPFSGRGNGISFLIPTGHRSAAHTG